MKFLKYLYNLLADRHGTLKTYSHTEDWKCECGRIFIIYHNLYGSGSGCGSCECGARVTVN